MKVFPAQGEMKTNCNCREHHFLDRQFQKNASIKYIFGKLVIFLVLLN